MFFAKLVVQPVCKDLEGVDIRDRWWKFCVWLTGACRPMRAWDEELVLRYAELGILVDFGFGSLGLEIDHDWLWLMGLVNDSMMPARLRHIETWHWEGREWWASWLGRGNLPLQVPQNAVISLPFWKIVDQRWVIYSAIVIELMFGRNTSRYRVVEAINLMPIHCCFTRHYFSTGSSQL